MLVSTENHAYNELMSIDDIYHAFQSDISNAISFLQKKGCTEIYLFGSVARNECTDQSDIDIAVRGISAEHFFTIYGELLGLLEHNVDLIDLELQPDIGNSLIQNGELRKVA